MVTRIRTTNAIKRNNLARALHGVGLKPWLEGFDNDLWIVCFEADKQEAILDETIFGP